MSKSQKAKQYLISELTKLGLSQDRYGHFKLSSGNIRIKMQKTSWRLEKRLPSGSWYKTTGNYYTKYVAMNYLLANVAAFLKAEKENQAVS